MPASLRLALVLVASWLLAQRAAAELKIGTVDLNRVFAEFYKSKDAERRVNEARTASRKEFEERIEHRRTQLEELQKLQEGLQRTPPPEKTAASDPRVQDLERRVAALRELERELDEFRRTRERQLVEQATRLRNGLVEEILRAVQEKVKQDGYDLVFDLSGQSIHSVPVLLVAREGFDFTAAIVARLNESKPKSLRAGS